MVESTQITPHGSTVAPGLHAPINLYYPTATAREAGTGELNGVVLSAKHLYQWAYQVDTQTFWALVSMAPLTWVQINLTVTDLSAIHSAMVPPNLHAPINLGYPNATDRENGANEVNGVTLTEAHVGQWAKQLDDGTHWELLTFGPITWAPVGASTGGVREPTTENMDVYLSPTGDDDTGDGSSGAPYATFTRAWADVKDLRILHRARLIPAAGVYNAFPDQLLLEIGPGGSAVMDASGEAYPVVAGPFTADTVDDVGPLDPFSGAMAYDITVDPDPSWAVDLHYGKFLYFHDGDSANMAYPIRKSTNYALRTFNSVYGFAPGDSFSIVSSPVVINVNHQVTIMNVGPSDTSTSEPSARLGIAGIEMRVATGDWWLPPMVLEGMNLFWSLGNLVDMWDTDHQSTPLVLRDSSVNWGLLPAGSFANADLEKYFGYSFAVLPYAGSTTMDEGTDIVVYDSGLGRGISLFSCRRKVLVSGDHGSMWWCMVGGVTNFLGDSTPYSLGVGSVDLNTVYMDQLGWEGTAIDLYGHHAEVVSCYIDNCELPMRMNGGAYVAAAFWHAGVVSGKFGLEIQGASTFKTQTSDPFSVGGTDGAIQMRRKSLPPFYTTGIHKGWPMPGAEYEFQGTRVLGLNGSEFGSVDREIYLDAVSGDDANGSGSNSAPFKTFTRVFDDFKDRTISAVLKILPVAGQYTDFPERLELNFAPGGRVVIDGSGNPDVVINSHTITGLNNVGPPDIWGDALQTELITSSAGWTPGPDPYYGYFMRFKSGNYNGKVMPIWTSSNPTAYAIVTSLAFYSFGPDDFDVVDCPVRIDVAHGISIVANYAGVQLQEAEGPQLCVAAVEFHCGDSSTYEVTPLELVNLSAVFSFSKLIDKYTADAQGVPLVLRNSKVDYDNVPANTFDDDELEDWFARAFYVMGKGGTPSIDNGVDVMIHDSSWAGGIASLMCRRRIFTATRSAPIIYSACGGISTRGQSSAVWTPVVSNLFLDHVIIHQLHFDDTCIEAYNCHISIDHVYQVSGKLGLYMWNGSFCRVRWWHGGSVNYPFAAVIAACSDMYVENPSASRVSIIGSLGVIGWEWDGSYTAAWPGWGGFVQKAGSHLEVQGSTG